MYSQRAKLDICNPAPGQEQQGYNSLGAGCRNDCSCTAVRCNTYHSTLLEGLLGQHWKMEERCSATHQCLLRLETEAGKEGNEKLNRAKVVERIFR